MSFDLIREYVKLSLSERIRSGRFSLAQFKEIDEPEEMLAYCEANLQRIGEGSGRTVYVLSSGKVLKLATGAGGQEQNAAEATIAKSAAAAPVVTRVFEKDPGNLWIIAELVRPTVDDPEFMKLLGVPGMYPEDLTRIAFAANKREMALMLRKWPAAANSPTVMEYINALRAIRQEFELNTFDVERGEHWGKTVDGRLVLLDYGLVDNMEFYQ
jgi:hypothetical protein